MKKNTILYLAIILGIGCTAKEEILKNAAFPPPFNGTGITRDRVVAIATKYGLQDSIAVGYIATTIKSVFKIFCLIQKWPSAYLVSDQTYEICNRDLNGSPMTSGKLSNYFSTGKENAGTIFRKFWMPYFGLPEPAASGEI